MKYSHNIFIGIEYPLSFCYFRCLCKKQSDQEMFDKPLSGTLVTMVALLKYMQFFYSWCWHWTVTVESSCGHTFQRLMQPILSYKLYSFYYFEQARVICWSLIEVQNLNNILITTEYGHLQHFRQVTKALQLWSYSRI